MGSNIIRLGLAFLKGFVAAITLHGLALLGVKSAEMAWHQLGHIAGIVALQMVTGH